jgi:protein-S-isoprenylcysteine O-methyltransferase Ste14
MTGTAGAIAAVIGFFALRGVTMEDYQKTLIMLAITAAPMIVVDATVYGTWRTALAAAPVRALSVERSVRKFVGFWTTILALAAIYWLLPEYRGDFYDSIRSTALMCAPWVVAISPFYIAYVDRRQPEPEDIYAQLGALVLSGRAPNRELLLQHVRGWLVKGFFLPLMFVYLDGDLADAWGYSLKPESFSQAYELSFSLLYLVDVLFATIGYICTLRLFDTQIRTADPSLFGWVICLICYEPFWSVTGSNYLAYDSDGHDWGYFLSGQPFLYVLWGTIIIIAVAIYVSATLVFGLRFSNLTNRGIITTGPYRWIKHPAYVCKNLSWWLVSVPMFSTAGWQVAFRQSLLLLLLNGIYALRAFTEERHLAQDPAYREYQAFIREHGLVARLRWLIWPKRP